LGEITMKKIIIIIATIVLFCSSFCQDITAESIPGQIYEGGESITYRNVTVYAPAVAQTDSGYVGVISTITVTIQSNGSGRVFVDTLPLTQVDMQGSARLAVKVASTIVENDKNIKIDPSKYDYFFVVRTSSPVIGGPSAGAIMTVATISLLENWEMDNETIMTGMINPDGSIGPIGGIPQKIDAAYSVGAKHFLIPFGQGTYTEMITTTESDDGWTRIVTKQVTRNVADYAMDNYGITVTEVADIYEALENFTGYRFFFNETDGRITTEDYINSIRPLATSLLDEARSSYGNAESKFNESNIPRGYPYYRTEVEDRLDLSKQNLDRSQDWFDQKIYYTSTSKSFQSLIYSRFVNYSCDFFESDEEIFIEDLINGVQSEYEKASTKAKNAQVTGFISLQSVGAAQRRAGEAKMYLDTAIDAYENRNSFSFDPIEFLYDLAFVVERSKSVGWWLDIGSHFNETGELKNETLENLALEYIEEAQQATVYSSLIIEEAGISGDSLTYLTYAEDLLQTSRNNLTAGYPAAALFQALEAIVRANLAIEVIGIDPENKIELAKKSASEKIAKSRLHGIEPVLAVSYYEYGESLFNETEIDSALLYYKYSGMIAGVLSFTNTSTGTASSKYLGIPELKEPLPVSWLINNFEIIMLIAILSLVAGIGLGLIISGITLNKKEKKIEQAPKFIDENIKGPEEPYFPKEEMPRSIIDYYKKNK
jgi:uncharacterized protein